MAKTISTVLDMSPHVLFIYRDRTVKTCTCPYDNTRLSNWVESYIVFSTKILSKIHQPAISHTCIAMNLKVRTNTDVFDNLSNSGVSVLCVICLLLFYFWSSVIPSILKIELQPISRTEDFFFNLTEVNNICCCPY
jgi:hypothetical protein